MHITSLFFENLFGILSLPFQTLGTSQSSVTATGTSTALTAADCLTDGVKAFNADDPQPLTGTTSIASATATVATFMQVNDVDYPDVQLTKAYVESLNEEELTELISKLDDMEIKISEDNEEVLVKRI